MTENQVRGDRTKFPKGLPDFSGFRSVSQACVQAFGTGICLHDPDFTEQLEPGRSENFTASAKFAPSLIWRMVEHSYVVFF